MNIRFCRCILSVAIGHYAKSLRGHHILNEERALSADTDLTTHVGRDTKHFGAITLFKKKFIL